MPAVLVWVVGISGFGDSYVLEDIGDPSSPGSISYEGDEVILTSSGTGSQSDSDQFTFAGHLISGDFDIQVRVVSVELGDLWSGGGLMARGNADTNSAFAAIYATPGSVGCYFQYRSTPGNISYRSGYFPANHPYTWLRLRRSGNELTAYAGIEGTAWTWVGEATVELPDGVHIGLVALSADAEQSTTARFRDVGDVTSPTVVSMAELPFEPMGPSSRNTALAISEIMYHPSDELSTSSLEYIELHNTDGVILSDRIDEDRFVIPAGTILPGRGFLVYDENQLGFAFGAAGGWIIVKNPSGTRVLDAVQYRGQENGVSTGRYPDGATSMRRLQVPTFGSPNARIAVSPVGINEIMAHPITEEDDDQFVELHNNSTDAVDISGWAFVDGISFEFPAGTSIPADG